MKLIIKTLQQSTFTVATEPEKTVKDLKEQIEKEHGKDYPSGAQKLIYSGKILADESKLSEYNIDEKKFIVLMITRPPPAPKPQTSEKTASTSIDKHTAEARVKAKEKASDDKSSIKSNTSSSATTISAPSATANPSTTPSANQPATRSSARLSSSTPSNNPPTATAAPAINNEASILSAMTEPQLANRLAMIMSLPQFRQIQDHIQQSPHLLSQTIESLAASDPEMYNFISDNPDVFVNALNHPPMAGHRSQASRTAPGEQQQARPADVQQGRQGPGVEQLLGNVSEHDKEAIERLKELGFSEYLAVQAYMACDKDEQLAANLLFQMDQ